MEQQRIIQLIKSKSLIDEINRLDYKFTDLQLVRIVYDYAHTYEQRLQLLREIAASSKSQQACELAKKSIRYQMESMEKFKTPSTNTVYEIHICDHPDSYEERYLCRIYEAALQLFHTFHAHFECIPREEGRYWIICRKFVDDNTADVFSEDEVGVCYLTKDCKVRDVDFWELDKVDCDRNCENCDGVCLNNVSIDFPNFLEEYDVVQYSDFKRSPHLGISVNFFMSDVNDDAYILPLDSVYAEYGDYENIHNSHQHVTLADIEKIDVNTLDDVLRKRYESLVSYLKKWIAEIQNIQSSGKPSDEHL